MSKDLLDAIDVVIALAIDEGVSLNDLRMAIHDSYIEEAEADDELDS